MSDEPDKFRSEAFLSRWSRVKKELREQPATDADDQQLPAIDPQAPPPVLPSIEELTIESDFRGFFHPKVDVSLRRLALKKLFSDPHFNIMDGLDTYIDDYSISDPLPPEMLAQLKHAQKIIAWAKETQEETDANRAAETAEAIQNAAASLPAQAALAADPQAPLVVAQTAPAEHVEQPAEPQPATEQMSRQGRDK